MDSKRSEAVGRVQTHKTNRSETSQRELKAKALGWIGSKRQPRSGLPRARKPLLKDRRGEICHH